MNQALHNKPGILHAYMPSVCAKIFQQKSRIKKTVLAVLIGFSSITGMAQTYSTVAAGNWTSPSTWAGGAVPTVNITSGMVVNIRHKVTCDLTNDIVIAGRFNVVGDTLHFPITFTKKVTVTATGQLVVMNGGFMQHLQKREAELIVSGGYLKLENSRVDIGKSFDAVAGGKRSIKNCVVKIGERYLADGSSSAIVRDTVQNSSIEVSLSGGGHLEIKDYAHLKIANARFYVNDGDFKTDGNSSVSLLAGPSNYYGFIILKVQHNLDVSGPWDAKIDAYCVDNDIKGSAMAGIDFTRDEDCSLRPTPSTLGQMVINEVYTDPGAGKHEFVELYNISSQPESMNNYTLLTYFDGWVAGVQQKGFYVLDFPDFTVAPRSFFVGAAAMPFNFQNLSNSMAANFNWNNLLSGSNGSLKKWVVSSDNNETDGNRFYNQAPLSGVLVNDLFNRLTGDVAFTFLLYKNGILVNQIIAGAGGNNTLSSSITSMPMLNVDMAGSSPDFAVDFSAYRTMPLEVLSMDAGSDNGFIRTVDGACSSWKKSSAGTTHTPGGSNGTIVAGTSGDIIISSSVMRGNEVGGSTLNYKVQSASSSSFAVEMRIYLDNGFVEGQFDLGDTHLETKTAYSTAESFSLMFKPYDEDILIVAKQGSGCVDNITYIKQGHMSLLPITFTSFAAIYENSNANLIWSVIEAEGFSHFVLQRSTNGVDFTNLEIVFSGGPSFSTYTRKDKTIAGTSGIYYYRIKGVDKSGAVSYSQTRIIQLAKESQALHITAFPNPVKDQLRITLPAEWQGKRISIEAVSASGVVAVRAQYSSASQTESLNVLDLQKGIYTIKVQCGDEFLYQRIVKN
jgi:hypothetical protein